VVRNTFVAWGPSFKQQTRVDAPVSLADVTPTVLAMFGVESGVPGSGRGRVLHELLTDGPSPSSVETTRRTLRTSAGAYRASLNISTVNGVDYVDTGSREP